MRTVVILTLLVVLTAVQAKPSIALMKSIADSAIEEVKETDTGEKIQGKNNKQDGHKETDDNSKSHADQSKEKEKSERKVDKEAQDRTGDKSDINKLAKSATSEVKSVVDAKLNFDKEIIEKSGVASVMKEAKYSGAVGKNQENINKQDEITKETDDNSKSHAEESKEKEKSESKVDKEAQDRTDNNSDINKLAKSATSEVKSVVDAKLNFDKEIIEKSGEIVKGTETQTQNNDHDMSSDTGKESEKSKSKHSDKEKTNKQIQKSKDDDENNTASKDH